MNRIPLPNRALALPLISVVFMWAFFMAGQYLQLRTGAYSNNASNPSAWLFLAGFVIPACASLRARGWAYRADASQNASLVRAAQRFTNLGLVLSLVGLTIFVFITFISAFSSYSQSSDLGMRFAWVYGPIIVATGVIVFVMLRALVFGHKTEGGEKTRMNEQQRALALGYAVPILCTAFAIILGLAIYDATRTTLDVWIWVTIVSIIGVGVILGTRFATKARGDRTPVVRTRAALAEGAATLNFVLSVVFGGGVGILAFANGIGAIEKLRSWNVNPDGNSVSPMWNISDISWNWVIRDFAPAKLLILIATVGVYLAITERHRTRKES
ncbi:MAG: hypothetical protein RLZZ164_294 [Actinomycetota bacterium]|jgi:cytochrome bd-type quinol oxidase subunit 2